MKDMLARLRLIIVGLFASGWFLCSLASTLAGRSSPASLPATDSGFPFRVPRGLSASLWRKSIPADNPLTREKVALGKALYFDKRLSADGTLSCATCHDPAAAFADHNPLSTGIRNQIGTRNVPTVLNATFNQTQFWDGRARILEDQAKGPLVNAREMGMASEEAVVAQVAAIPEYRKKFRQVFGRIGITIETIVKAIAAFERTQLSGNSPFDRFMAGEERALTQAQKRGWDLFQKKAQCINCHVFSKDSPFFTDFKFHNTGIEMETPGLSQLAQRAREMRVHSQSTQTINLLSDLPGFATLGRYLVTNRPEDVGAFKTPGLRDVELTSPYMHNGSQKT